MADYADTPREELVSLLASKDGLIDFYEEDRTTRIRELLATREALACSRSAALTIVEKLRVQLADREEDAKLALDAAAVAEAKAKYYLNVLKTHDALTADGLAAWRKMLARERDAVTHLLGIRQVQRKALVQLALEYSALEQAAAGLLNALDAPGAVGPAMNALADLLPDHLIHHEDIPF